MSDFQFFDSWNKVFRWIAFIPMFFVTYIITFFLGKYIFWYGYGWVGMSEDTVIGFLIYHLYLSFLGFYMPIIISVSCAPKGKIIISSIYLGLILLLAGFSALSLFIYGDGRPLWQSIYDYTLNVAGSIFALLSVIYEHKKELKDKEFEKILSA